MYKYIYRKMNPYDSETRLEKMRRYEDIESREKALNNIAFCAYAHAHIAEINALILDGPSLATTHALIKLANCKPENITIAEIDDESFDKIMKDMPDEVSAYNGNIAELVIDSHVYNAAYFDFMATLDGSLTTGIRPIVIIRDFLENSTCDAVVFAATFSLRSCRYSRRSDSRRKTNGERVINRYRRELERTICDAGFHIKGREAPKKYRRGIRAQTMGFFVYALVRRGRKKVD